MNSNETHWYMVVTTKLLLPSISDQRY